MNAKDLRQITESKVDQALLNRIVTLIINDCKTAAQEGKSEKLILYGGFALNGAHGELEVQVRQVLSDKGFGFKPSKTGKLDYVTW